MQLPRRIHLVRGASRPAPSIRRHSHPARLNGKSKWQYVRSVPCSNRALRLPRLPCRLPIRGDQFITLRELPTDHRVSVWPQPQVSTATRRGPCDRILPNNMLAPLVVLCECGFWGGLANRQLRQGVDNGDGQACLDGGGWCGEPACNRHCRGEEVEVAVPRPLGVVGGAGMPNPTICTRHCDSWVTGPTR